MAEVDIQVTAKTRLPEINLAKIATEGRKMAAEKKHNELKHRRKMLERAQRQRARAAAKGAGIRQTVRCLGCRQTGRQQD